MIYDAHCHLDLLDDMQRTINSANLYGLHIFAVGTTPKAYSRECRFCSGSQNVSVGLGMHPQLIGGPYEDMGLFRKLCGEARYIGEVGLDFSKGYIGSKDSQIRIFNEIIGLCEKYGNKVVSIHSLKSVETVLDVLQNNRCDRYRNNSYILHWYTGSQAQLKKAIDFGCYFSINPRMLKTASGKSVIASLPDNRLLVETDAPFGVKVKDINEIKRQLEITVDGISALRGEDMSEIISDNSKRLFSR